MAAGTDATDGPRLYYQALSRAAAPAEPIDVWRIKQVLLNGNEEAVIAGTSDRPHSVRIRGLSSDDTQFLGLSPFGEKWVAVTLPVVGGSPRRLGEPLLADDAAWSHNGRALAYSRDNHLFLANPDGTGSRELATVPGSVAYLAWSPDDRRLSFTILTEQQTLWEVGADGRGLHQRRFNWSGKATECCGAWTPDERYFVFKSRHGGASKYLGGPGEIKLVASDQSRPRPIDLWTDELRSAASQSQRQNHLRDRVSLLGRTGPIRCEAKKLSSLSEWPFR